MIELALAFTDKDGSYSEHAAAALASVFRNTSSELQVHILHDDSLLDENKNKLAQLAADFKHPIHFYPVTLPVEMMDVLSGTGSIDRWTWGSLYRLLLPAVVPAERVIYLDCDVMVNMDITELWEIDLNGGYLGAIHDQGIHGIAEVVAVQGLNPETYFNSGVLVFDLNAIRQHVTWFEEILNFFRAFPGTSMPDQDCLNHVFGGNCLLLDQRFNWFYVPGAEMDLQQKIVHFAGDMKCWDPLSPGYALYQDNLRLTPWSKEPIPPAPIKRSADRKARHLLMKRKTRKHSPRKPSSRHRSEREQSERVVMRKRRKASRHSRYSRHKSATGSGSKSSILKMRRSSRRKRAMYIQGFSSGIYL
ncbi:glycosyltransferase family 8 protein [Paenibacillus cellulositrophicus]|uniref:glycosyltransferase family 8 protein n=1 Tax=Paenibacillus cellulositrophicus TaxID=562959 RepID=UPI001266F552|nr:glycosyltransferase family 8 protein [Paenibacillus cellulositrophicus]